MRRALACLAAIAIACGPAVRPSPAPPASAAASCASCHAEEHARWVGARHRASFRDADFQAAFREEPLAFCVDCHAPRRAELGAAGEEAGVDCMSCHTDAATHARAPLAKPARPHAERAAASCPRCHEFASLGSATLLQSTVSEHGASPYRDVSCVDCHMPARASGRRDHGMAVSRDAAFLARAVALREVRRVDGDVEVEIASSGVGHLFPTGDIFRSVFVRVWVEDPGGKILADAEQTLRRDVEAHRRDFGSPARGEQKDTRLGDAPLVLRLAMPAAASGGTVRVQIDYRRGAAMRGGALLDFASLRIADLTAPLPDAQPPSLPQPPP